MSLFQSKCRYRVVEQYILGSYESNYNMVEEFNYSFSESIQISTNILNTYLYRKDSFISYCFILYPSTMCTFIYGHKVSPMRISHFYILRFKEIINDPGVNVI